MKIIYFMLIGINIMLASDIFTDNKTGLMWQDDSEAESIVLNWEDANQYCSDLTLSGYNDWRLPSIKELLSIVDMNRFDPAIKQGFKYIFHEKEKYGYYYEYWSSTPSDTSDLAWIVDFHNGSTDRDNKMNKEHIRCVRGKSPDDFLF